MIRRFGIAMYKNLKVLAVLETNNLKNELLTAFQQNNFFNLVYEKSISERENLDNLTAEIVNLHNENALDIIKLLKELNNSEKYNDWYSIYNVFSKVIPKINTSVLSVIECVSNLDKNFKNIGLTTYQSYVEFCNVDENRFKEALGLIEDNISELIDFLDYTLIAGSKSDIEYYLNATLRLFQHKNIDVRRRAISSLGNLHYLENPVLSEKAISAFESIATQEMDNNFLASLIYASFDLYRQDKSTEQRVVKLITDIINKNDDILTLITQLFHYSNILPEPLLNIIFSHLYNVSIEDEKTLSLIDSGLYRLLIGEKSDKAIIFLEALLIKNSSSLSLNNFGCVFSFFYNTKNIALLNKITTRWFLRGDKVLCDGIHNIASESINNNILLSIDPSELDVINSDDFIFIARKSIGYLFTHPVTIASIIISLIENTNDIQTINALGGLLFDPLLINYQGKLKDYLVKQLDSENEHVKAIVDLVLKESEKYFDNINSVGNIPELNPSQSQREAYWRQHSRIMSESMKASRKQSFLSSFCSTSVLLYGNKSIEYVEGIGSEEPRRMEMPLHSHSVSFEYPRTEHIDSLGFNHMLLMFKTEKIKQ